jgi:hypothetical protein
MQYMKQKQLIGLIAAAGLLIGGGLAQGSEFTWTFETDPTTGTNPLELGGNVADSGDPAFDGMWRSVAGEGSGSDGFLAITYPVGSQQGYGVFPDIDNGEAIVAFELEADIRSGNSTGDRAADGWSVSLARSTDPVLVFLENNPGENIPGGEFGGAYEFGTTTGVAISFDTWAGNTLPDGAADIEGLIVRVDNQTITTVALPTRHGDCADDTSLQTGPRNQAYWDAGGDPYAPEAWEDLCWQSLRVVVTETGLVSVYWKDRAVLENFQTEFFPSPGRVILAGRTGGANSNVHFDNIRLVTTTVPADNEPPTTPGSFETTHVGAGSIGLLWGESTDNSGQVGYELERDGVQVGGARTATDYVDVPLAKLTTYNYRVRATDVAGNKSDWVTLTATTIDDVAGSGGVKVDIFDGLTGVLVYENFVTSPRWGTAPDRGSYLNALSFGEWTGFGNTYGDNLAVMITGVITPPVSGAYHFFTRSDDGSEFHLNETGATPPDPLQTFANATESGCCRAFQEPGAGQNTEPGYETTFPTTEEPINLTAGTGYGFLYMVKEGGGGDWGQVAWRLEGDTTPAGQLGPIPGIYLSGSRVDPVGTTISITGPNDQSVVEEQLATISATIDVESPYPSAPYYQWMRDGVDIVGASGTSYSFVTSMADDGAKFSVKVGAQGLLETSQEMTLTILPDTIPPVPSAGALVSSDGTTVDIGVGFNEAVDDTTAGDPANYAISAGTVNDFIYYPESQSVLAKVTDLGAGDSAVITVQNVEDVKGNAITSVDVPVTVSETLTWGVVGAAEEGLADNFVVPVDDDGFDVFSNGFTEWASYDEATFVYEEVTGDFDKKLQVVYQDNSSQWARAGLIVREDLTVLGMDRATAEAGGAGRYQKVHANPVGPTLTGPGTDGNNTYETNRRLTLGGATDAPGSVSPVNYPNVWVRLQREAGIVRMYWGEDGQAWSLIAETTFDPVLPDTVYVGPEYSPENGNVTNVEDRGRWLAKFRNYGDTFGAAAPTLSYEIDASGNIILNFDGTAEWADEVEGPYTDSGLTSPLTLTPDEAKKYIRAVW